MPLASPADAARGADIVLAMLADDEASRSVWLGDGGALAAMRPQTIAIESSTLTVDWIRELAAAAEARGMDFSMHRSPAARCRPKPVPSHSSSAGPSNCWNARAPPCRR
jgi:hypothetical protein